MQCNKFATYSMTSSARASNVGGISVPRAFAVVILTTRLPHQHIRRLDADTDHPGEQAHHRMRPRIRCPLEPLGTCLLDRADLLTDQCQPCHVAPELLDDVCR